MRITLFGHGGSSPRSPCSPWCRWPAARIPSPRSSRHGRRPRRAPPIGSSRFSREAEILAAEERTLLGDLRKLEIERDLRVEEARRLDAEAASVTARVDEATRQIGVLDQAIQAARPGLNARLVEVYKLGRPGYARVLLGVGGVPGHRPRARAW